MSPIFDYQCGACGEKKELLQKREAKPPTCDCGAVMIQVWSTPSPAIWKCPRSTL